MTGYSYVLNALGAQGEEFSPDKGMREGLLKFSVGYTEHEMPAVYPSGDMHPAEGYRGLQTETGESPPYSNT